MKLEKEKLGKLARLAGLRSDAELERFAAFRRHVEALRAERAERSSMLHQLLIRQEPFTLSGAASAHVQAGRLARDIARIDDELDRLRPNYTAALGKAQKEFGRVRVLEELADRAQPKKALRR
ncbi:hypothetical protein [Paracoccus albus]|uniref:hypothetical protein n=1 Tax=Paracoccus albus TaxID=3017784 RepID=UPI0022F07F8F|nr:hypothetical protein [Paracoccus albus]WBU60216.1 hypothetical protein PAF20_15985 [Paracoccus albus]